MSLLALLLGGSATAPVEPDPWVWDADTHLVVAGNSHLATWVYPGMGSLLHALAPISSGTYADTAFPGWTLPDLIANAHVVDGVYAPGKRCYLVIMEDCNTINLLGKTVPETLTLARQYITGRRAAHPWAGVAWCGDMAHGGNPAQLTAGGLTTAEANLRRAAVADAIAADPADYGVDRFIKLDDIPGLDGDGSTLAEFTGRAADWWETGAPYVHWIGGLRTAVRDRIASVITS